MTACPHPKHQIDKAIEMGFFVDSWWLAVDALSEDS